MNEIATIGASLASLALISAIYYCNIVSRPTSWLRSEMLAMILLSILTGLFPLALAAVCIGLWHALTGGFSLAALLAGGIDLMGAAVIVATVIVFRSLVKATYRNVDTPTNLTPLTPRPALSAAMTRSLKQAA